MSFQCLSHHHIADGIQIGTLSAFTDYVWAAIALDRVLMHWRNRHSHSHIDGPAILYPVRANKSRDRMTHHQMAEWGTSLPPGALMLLPPGTDPKWLALGAWPPGTRSEDQAKHSTWHTPIPSHPYEVWVFFFLLSMPLLHYQPAVSVSVSTTLALTTPSILSPSPSVLSVSIYSTVIPSTVPAHIHVHPPPPPPPASLLPEPIPQVLAQASVTGSNRLGQLNPPLSSSSTFHVLCLCVPACLGYIG